MVESEPEPATSPSPPTAHEAVVALPSETTIRFLLLVGALVASILVVAESAYYTVRADHVQASIVRCELETAELADPEVRSDAVADCRRHDERERVLWTVATLAVAGVVAVAGVAAFPVVRRSRRRLGAVPPALGMQPAIAEQWSLVGVSTVPEVVWDPRRVGGAAEVWWRPGRYEVELSPGLISAVRKKTPQALTVLRHEGAHLRNRDVALGSIANGALLAFALAAVVPFLVVLFWFDGPRSTIVTALLRLTVVGVVIVIARAATLRSRELDADARAATVADVDLAAGQHSDERTTMWHSLVAHHPSPVRRQRCIDEPLRLLDVRVLDGFIAGFVTFVYYPTIARLVNSWFTGTGHLLDAQVWTAALFAIPLGVWLGLVGVRLSAARVHGGPARLGVAVGVGLAAGAVCGLLLMDEPLYQQVDWISGGTVEVLTLVLLALALVGLSAWSVAVAANCLSPRTSSRRTYAAVVALCCLGVAAVVSKMCETWRNTRIAGAVRAPGEGLVFTTLEHLWLVGTSGWFAILAVAIATLPLVVGSFVRRGADPSDDGVTTRSDWMQIGMVVIAGATTGGVAFVGYLLFERRLGVITTEVERSIDSTGLRLVLVAEYGIVLVGMIGGVVVALLARGRSVVYALLAVATAAVVASTAVVVRFVRQGDELTLNLVAATAGQIIPLAVVAGIACASAYAAIGGRVADRTGFVAVGSLAIAAVSLPVFAYGGAASAAAHLSAFRETVGPYREWWRANSDVVISPLSICIPGDDVPDPRDFGEKIRVALDDAQAAISSYHPQSSTVENFHRTIAGAIESCVDAVQRTGSNDEQLTAVADHLIGWNNDVSTFTGDEFNPIREALD